MKIELIAKHAAGQPITVVCESTGRRANYDFVMTETAVASLTSPRRAHRTYVAVS